MSKLRVVVTRRIYPELLAPLAQDFALVDNQQDTEWSSAELAHALKDAYAALSTASDRIDAALLAQCPQLRAVCNIAVGYNNVDIEACTQLGVVVTNTPDVLTEATADHAWALLLAAARRVTESERWLRAGHWTRWTFDMFNGADLFGATLGVLGMGRIGAAVARRAQGFGMRVIYHNRTRPASTGEAGAGATWVDKQTLLRESDHLVIVVPYSPQTHHLIGAAELALMKPGAVLVNIARGGVVDDAALIDALRAKRIAAAGLDVFEGEPKLQPGFLGLDNVALTPHIASSTRATRTAMAQLAIRNLRAVLADEKPPCLVNSAVWETRRR